MLHGAITFHPFCMGVRRGILLGEGSELQVFENEVQRKSIEVQEILNGEQGLFHNKEVRM
jgi:hypothetical protein